MSEPKVRDEIHAGNIPCIKYGSRQVIPKWKLIESINNEIEYRENVQQLDKGVLQEVK